MTTATINNDVENFEIPDVMPEQTFTTVHRVKVSEFKLPTGKRAEGKTNRGEPLQVEYHAVFEPLSVKYDSDPAMFDHNDDEFYLSVFRKDGQLNGKGSLIDLFKNAALKAGFPITNAATAKALEGKIFVTKREGVTFMFDQINPTSGIKEKVESKPQYVTLLVERMPDDWQPEGEVRTVQRPQNWRNGGVSSAPSAPAQADNSATAMPILVKLLDGKTEAEYQSALLGADASVRPEVLRAPYITEATTDKPALTARMVAAGMTVVDGKLTA